MSPESSINKGFFKTEYALFSRIEINYIYTDFVIISYLFNLH